MLSSSDKFQSSSTGYLCKQYKIDKCIGKGSFGCVLKCKKGQSFYAIKVLHKTPEFYELGLHEISLLKNLKHPNVVSFVHHFVDQGHLSIVFELLGPSLYEILKKRDYKGFNLKVIASISEQLLSVLIYLREKKICHADLKPENVLFVEEFTTKIKLIDFGSACIDPKYSYIQSRYYRSPEVLLSAPYGVQMDMFSFGVMLAELYTGKPLFAGENEHSQLILISKILGKPPQYILYASNSLKIDKFFGTLCSSRLLL
eukprot:NODE_570_length_5905_cov_0.420944.p3 type:complete len:257 gc:universal NODE_570_length_5905_cov_0.420944:3695-4465(+)